MLPNAPDSSPMLSDAYAAGFIDGEGSVIIGRVRPSGEKRSPRYPLRVTVKNTYKPILDDLATTYGGVVNEANSGSNGFVGRKPCWYWAVSGHEAAACLRRIRPHMREKEPQAWLALEYWEQRDTAIQRNERGHVLPTNAEELALREGYHLAMSGLK